MGMSRTGRGWLWRALVAVVVIAGGTALYVHLRPAPGAPLVPHLASYKGYARAAPWFAEHRVRWDACEFVELRDATALSNLVAEWVGDRLPEGPVIDEGLLTRDVARFLGSLGVESSDAYLRSVTQWRALRDPGELADERFIQALYHELTGRTFGPDMDTRTLLKVFWKSHPDAVARPSAVARMALLEVRQSLSDSQSPRKHADDPYYAATWPRFTIYTADDYLNNWQSPISRACPAITHPRTSYEHVVKKYDVTAVCRVSCIIRSTDGLTGLLHAYLYFSPDEGVWHLENAWNEMGHETYWPI